MKRSLTKRERLRSKTDISRVFRLGRSSSVGGAKLVTLSNDLPFSRFLVTTARGFSRAVDRNRARRHGKEILRTLEAPVKAGLDIVLVLYPGTYDFRDRYRQIGRLLSKRGVCDVRIQERSING